MKSLHWLVAWLAVFSLTGCKRTAESGSAGEARHGHAAAEEGKPDAHGHSHGHEEEAEPSSGASYKKGQGVSVKDETKKLLGLETAEVTGQALARKLEFTTQAFRLGTGEAMPRWRATGTLPTGQIAELRVGQEVALHANGGESFTGRVELLDESLLNLHGEGVVVVEFTQPGTNAGPVTFLQATVALPEVKGAVVVPGSAVLRTAEGTFVFVVNGEAYQRTAVKTGAQADGLVEITDGLLEGDSVVTKQVEALYLVELRAVKGGGHSH
ncbi:MAG: hypothetical protein J0M24_00370 [Verrucomicrobia bacterium]|nr:hypothetical protein [Verrucomicrobiota bacterium]